MLIVDPRTTWALFILACHASSLSSRPNGSLFHVDAYQVVLGKDAVVVAASSPLGLIQHVESAARRGGMPRRATPAAVEKSRTESSVNFSSNISPRSKLGK